MIKNALGLIETVGLAAAIEAADTALKAANVELLGREYSKGGGLIVIKICGDVAGVKAAVAAAQTAAAKVNKVYATHVIPRPQQELAGMIDSKDTIGRKACLAAPTAQADLIQAGASKPDCSQTDGIQAGQEAAAAEPAAEKLPESKEVPVKRPAEICNLCGDPACNRKKGDPKVTCIHYEKHTKEDE